MSAPCYQTVGIVLGPHENSSVVGRLHDLLSAKGIGIVHEAPERLQGDSDWKRYCASTKEDFSGRADLICCVGGDGTMLDAIALYHPYQTAVHWHQSGSFGLFDRFASGRHRY